MTDVHNSAQRSYNMSRIQGRDTRPEIRARKLLHAMGFRYRLHVKDLPGKPDLVFPAAKAVLFVHGCFWHGHDCPLFRWPKTRADFWQIKIGRNQSNDQKHLAALRDAGWRVAIVWECALRSGVDVGVALAEWIGSDGDVCEIRG